MLENRRSSHLVGRVWGSSGPGKRTYNLCVTACRALIFAMGVSYFWMHSRAQASIRCRGKVRRGNFVSGVTCLHIGVYLGYLLQPRLQEVAQILHIGAG
jgi:hypothetical protein